MSIGLVLRHTYQGTCEICDKISHFIRKSIKTFYIVCERIGYARAASYLASQGKYEEAKKLMLEKEKI